MRLKKTVLIPAALMAITAGLVITLHQNEIDFNTQVKPIFNKKCITCHGGVRRQANFSLLFRSEALSKTKSGRFAIIPGDPDHSEMIRRISSKDPEERMPYHHEPLSDKEITTLKNWIRQGAKWGNHWAYTPVAQIEVPQSHSSFFGLFSSSKNNWIRNNIDYFIYSRLQKMDLKPSIETDRSTLLRRVSFDLTGLPPSGKLAFAFLKNNNSNAYEALVDSLMASPHYGERWASVWLDLARYADTKGYERDAGRDIWHYRDWLIKAFNQNKPYDRFLIEQLAGDLLPNATDDQFIATAFHRNTMTNDEGGTDNEEFRTAAVIDRVNTTWQALMGTTFACVQCHSHPYDPFTHDEYYKFMAFFNDTRDEDTYADYPLLRHLSSSDSIKLEEVTAWLQKNGYHDKAVSEHQFIKTWEPAVNSLKADEFINCELNDTKWLAFRNISSARLKNIDLSGKDEIIFRYVGYEPGNIISIYLDKPGGTLVKKFVLGKTKDWFIDKIDFPVQSGSHNIYITYSNSNLKKPTDNGLMFDWFYFTDKFPGKGKQDYDSIQKKWWKLITMDVPTTPVMMNNPKFLHRATHVFERGNWLVQGKEVSPDVPHSLNPFPSGMSHDRLGLAKWITDKKNPLTARTMVNRIWEQIFGIGLVETLDDMGTQGAEPSNRELLDYLSYQFMYEFNWSIKKLVKEMVMSASYRQDSKVTKDKLDKDPENRFCSRGPRIRLSAEQIRDQAMAVSGLFNEKMYGPSVMPWQPEGIWMSPWNGDYWKESEGGEQYRRAIYTFWKRTAPYPSMISFDGVGREVCTARRIRTNTPLQALVTLNDSVYLVASRSLAYKMEGLSDKPGDIRSVIAKGYEAILFHSISPARLDALEMLYNETYQKLKNDPESTCNIVGVNNFHNNPHTSALVIVANALLNLDEVITKN